MRLLPVTDRPGPAVPGRGAAGRAAISAATLVAVMAATMVVAAPTSGAAESDPPTATPTPAAETATETVTETPEPTPTPEPSPAPSEDPVPTTEPTVEPTPTPEPTPAPEPTVTPEPTPTPEPYEPMRLGERSERIRVLESRLHQLGLHSEVITSLFERETRRAVASFKRSQKLKGRRGVVDERSWNRLVSLTRTPTADELNNVYTPGPAILKRGMRSGKVRHLEARLSQVKKFRGRVGARYDRKTQRAVRAFQKSVKIPVTGAVDARTRDRLHAATRRPTRSELRNWGFNLDPRCLSGRVMCIDKTTRSLKWVVGGEVKMRLDARFGDPYYPTRQGTFSVFKKSRDHVSSIYHTPMPFAMFFSGGQAVHYSPDFKANGYDGHSHGCVNIRHRKAIARLFDWVSLGDRVVVFRS